MSQAASALRDAGIARFAIFFGVFAFSCLARGATETDYLKVDALFQKHCLDCHNAKDAEGQLILESHDLLMKGGESGAVILPGRSGESILVRSVEGTFEKDGKLKIMPPGAKRKKLAADEITLLKTWIDAGARGPAGPVKAFELIVPKIPLKGAARQPITSLAFAPRSHQFAVGRYGQVEMFELGREPIGSKPRTDNRLLPAAAKLFSGHHGNVNALVFSRDASQMFAAAGNAGMSGEVRQWNVSDGKLVRVFKGHQDAIYSAALSPDGRVMATGSYDQKIKLWEVATGKERTTLTGHNGAIFGLAFRPDGKILASASADRTIKLWNVETGKRVDTLSQPLKEQYAVAFSADGKRLFAAGADSRIRVWQISETALETTNPLLDAHFAHEGAILRLVFAPDGNTLLSCADDRKVKFWDSTGAIQKLVLKDQPDWAAAVVFLEKDSIAVGRVDGSLAIYDAKTGDVIEEATKVSQLKEKE